jgi:hypothetical protein
LRGVEADLALERLRLRAQIAAVGGPTARLLRVACDDVHAGDAWGF